MTLFGPFSQALTLNNLPLKGHIKDDELEIISEAGILVKDGKIEEIGRYKDLQKCADSVSEIPDKSVVMPGLIDAHTHICYAGSRAKDYALKCQGKSYQEIARMGGGILHTVAETKRASLEELTVLLLKRIQFLIEQGITTIEVKSGYGLNTEDELKMLEAIQEAKKRSPAEIIPTCLASHVKPKEFESACDYLTYVEKDLLPKVKERGLSHRVDIFVDAIAFTADEARPFLKAAKNLGFDILIHADQFSAGGALLAAEMHAISADHLDVSSDETFKILSKANVAAVALPGASMGLGLPFPKGKKMLDAHLSLVIASDFNPGSAPMGQLLTQASVFGIAEKLSEAEVFAALTFRAAHALKLNDRGVLKKGRRADFIAFPCDNYQEILYYQGSMKPHLIYTGKNV